MEAASQPSVPIVDATKIEDEKVKTEEVIAAPGKPDLVTTNTVTQKQKEEETRLPPKKPAKKDLKKEDEVLSYVNKETKVQTEYVIPSPGHTNVNTDEILSNNQAAQPIIQEAPPKPIISKFNTTGDKQKETIADILKPQDNNQEVLPHSNAFGSEEETIVIHPAPQKPNLDNLIGSSLDSEDDFEDSAPFPQFNMNNKEEEQPTVKVKREGYHIVLKGETLYRISVNYGVTVGQLRKWNNLIDNTILLGQELKIKP